MKNSPYNYEDEFYCTQCGSRQLFNVPRPTAKQRPAGHLKKMFCFHCKTEKNFVECKPYATKYNYQDFLLEFYGGNFDEKGNRKKDYGLFKTEVISALNKCKMSIEDFIYMAKVNEGD